jgi:hypothetical protein
MTERVTIGDDGEWVDVSSSACDRVAGHAMDHGLTFQAALADLIKNDE